MSIYDSLNEQQKKGVFTTQGPVLILALVQARQAY